MTQNEVTQLKKEINPSLDKLINSAMKVQQLDKEEARLTDELTSINENIAKAQQQIDFGMQKMALGLQKQALALEKLAHADMLKRRGTSKLFLSALGLPTGNDEFLEKLHKTRQLANMMAVGKNDKKDRWVELKSIKQFVNILSEDAKLTKLDLSVFEDHIDIDVLSSLLKEDLKPLSNLKFIQFHALLSEEKQKLVKTLEQMSAIKVIIGKPR